MKGIKECFISITFSFFFQVKSSFNINCMNILGFTPLVIAAKRENLNMVEFLMNRPGIVIGDAILYAVRTGNKEIVEYLLDQQPVRYEIPF